MVVLLGFFVFYIHSLHARISKLESLLFSQSKRNVYAIDTANRPRIGDAQATLEVLVFSDFTCPHCTELYHQIERLRRDYIDSKKVSFVFFSYPMLSHENSTLLAAVGKYGNAINQFESFYHRLYQKQDSLNIKNITEYFFDLVPDTADFRARIMQSHQPAIEADIQLIKDFQIKGAPAFIIQDQLHLGLKTDERMKIALDEAVYNKTK
jgi:protein-disulfide isomerase